MNLELEEKIRIIEYCGLKIEICDADKSSISDVVDGILRAIMKDYESRLIAFSSGDKNVSIKNLFYDFYMEEEKKIGRIVANQICGKPDLGERIVCMIHGGYCDEEAEMHCKERDCKERGLELEQYWTAIYLPLSMQFDVSIGTVKILYEKAKATNYHYQYLMSLLKALS